VLINSKSRCRSSVRNVRGGFGFDAKRNPDARIAGAGNTSHFCQVHQQQVDRLEARVIAPQSCLDASRIVDAWSTGNESR
jgi:hypothetical protein